MRTLITIQFCLLFSTFYSQNSISLHNSQGETRIILQNTIDSITFTNFNPSGWLEFNPYLSYGSLVDQNGNLYKTIVIGSQEWMAENLRSITFTNGDSIPNLMLFQQWSSAIGPAWSHFANDSSYNIRHGKLYNGYTVIDTRNVCPNGWHVPTFNDWRKLLAHVGEFDTGYTWDKLITMGSSGYWIEYTNESGFSAFPSSHRYENGAWGSATPFVEPCYWSSTFTMLPSSNIILIQPVGLGSIPNGTGNPNSGLPIRCVKN